MDLFAVFFQEREYIDPITLKPDLYAAAVANDAVRVTSYLEQHVPGTFIDTANGWTVSLDTLTYYNLLELKLNVKPLHSRSIGQPCMEMSR